MNCFHPGLLSLYFFVIFLPSINGQICPTDRTLWHTRARIICKNRITTYHCLPTADLNASKEFCLDAIPVPEGFCAVFNHHVQNISYDRLTRCYEKNFTLCPQKNYLSNKSFKYSSCLGINPEKRCYLADLTCPDITRLYTSETSGPFVTSYQNTTASSPKNSECSHAEQLRPSFVIAISALFFTYIIIY